MQQIASSGSIVTVKWANSAFPISWRLNTTVGTNVQGSRTVTQVIQAAFQTWDDLDTAAISFSQGATTTATNASLDGQNTISFVPQNVGDFAINVIALTYTFRSSTTGVITESDIVFNPSHPNPLTTESTSVEAQIDIQSVATHEIGHLLGLDHSGMLTASMFPSISTGVIYRRILSTDDIIGVSTIYPTANFTSGRGSISGTVQTTGSVVYGALVVVVDGSGRPIVSTVSDPSGNYRVDGLEPGSYTVYAEPIDSPLQLGNVPTLFGGPSISIYPSSTPQTNFTTRFHP